MIRGTTMEKDYMELNEEIIVRTIETMMYLNPENPIKEIKVTSKFLRYLEVKYRQNIVLFNSEHVKEEFMGVPIVEDNTINHPYYEFVY
jgi:hypothetical protein